VLEVCNISVAIKTGHIVHYGGFIFSDSCTLSITALAKILKNIYKADVTIFSRVPL
jgi:hypothetical protein